jgi:negative regulator of flagellin synthesis FlgM
MSPYEVSRTQPITQARPLARQSETDRGSAPRTPVQARGGSAAGVAVETGFSVDAGEAPVDTDRVLEIRDAIRKGTYPVLPAKIADAMIAARLLLSTGE